MARAVEQFPSCIRYSVVHGLGYQRSALVIGATDNQRRLAYLVEPAGIVEIAESTRRRILIGAPCRKIRLRAESLRTCEAFR